MHKKADFPNRRTFLRSGINSAVIAVAVGAFTRVADAEIQSDATTVLFDGRTLDGWIQIQNSTTSIGGGDITDPAALTKKLTDKSDALSAFLGDRLDDNAKKQLAAFVASNTASAPGAAGAAVATGADAKAVSSTLAKNLNRIISGGILYDKVRFQNVTLRPETQDLLQQNPQGRDLVRLNRMLLEDAFPVELSKSVPIGWTVKDGVMASMGTGRGVIYTVNDYNRFRLMFTIRHVSGNPDHQACVLIFCTRPGPGEMPLDALGGIQLQVPKGAHWDYRPSQNYAGADFTTLVQPQFDPHEWSRVEILADAATGMARMAVAQPVGSEAVEILDFKNPVAGKVGPIAWQIHNAGLFDEYKDVVIETNPKSNDLITVKASYYIDREILESVG